jgi:molecular chaperone GrpE
LTRPTPDEGAVREAFKEEKRATGDDSADLADPPEKPDAEAEDGSTDEGAGEQPAPSDGPEPAFEATAEAPEQADAESAEPEAREAEPEDELTVAKRERNQYLDLAKRAQADFENFRKRASKDIAAASGRARNGLIRELLPVVDNLGRALDSAPADDPMAEGVKLVLMDLQGVLSRAGVEAIEPKGEPFDPNVHEALTTRSEDGVDAGIVLDVVEKGYRAADQVIRPARVIVAA